MKRILVYYQPTAYMKIRRAVLADLPAVVNLLANATRKRLDHFEKYEQAFEIIWNDLPQDLMVVVKKSSELFS